MKERPAAEVEVRGEVTFAARGHRQIRLENGTLASAEIATNGKRQDPEPLLRRLSG
jgi:hypothetical protein